jgi:hypothetical protein
MAELFDIVQRYADEDPTVDSDDEYGQRRKRRPACSDGRRNDYRFGCTRPVVASDATTRVPTLTSSPTLVTGSATPSTLATTIVAHERSALLTSASTHRAYSARPVSITSRRGNPPRIRLRIASHSRKSRKPAAPRRTEAVTSTRITTRTRESQRTTPSAAAPDPLHTFTGVGDRCDTKVLSRAMAINAVVTEVSRWLNWFEQNITWCRDDHTPHIEYPGRVALIVKPNVADYWLSKTLMDGGSSINIMY